MWPSISAAAATPRRASTATRPNCSWCRPSTRRSILRVSVSRTPASRWRWPRPLPRMAPQPGSSSSVAQKIARYQTSSCAQPTPASPARSTPSWPISRPGAGSRWAVWLCGTMCGAPPPRWYCAAMSPPARSRSRRPTPPSSRPMSTAWSRPPAASPAAGSRPTA